jgi:urea carboxylase
MLKSTAGGGGIGMQLVREEDQLSPAFRSVKRTAASAFGAGGVFLEKYVEAARHIEVQIFGDGRGNVVSLGERDCSVQRRNQKVIEEAPAPGLSDAQRRRLAETALTLARAAGYQSAGTVEFVLDASAGNFYFLEMNTRLQVEHGVTEEVTGVDLVEWMVRQAAGELDLSGVDIQGRGHAIQVRLYAEDPGRNFQPCSGLLTEAAFPATARVETWVVSGSEISPWYDPLIAKLIVKGDDREQAVEQLQSALAATRLAGIETNLAYLRQIAADAIFRAGAQTTRYLSDLRYVARTIEVLDPGVQTTVQDYPGRLGYWSVGVPPSGPMDSLAFRLANRLVGNPVSAAGLELTLTGPTLQFNFDTVVALAGAAMRAEIDGRPIARWQAHVVPAGSTLRLGPIEGNGARTYLAVAGGFEVPEHLGAKSTFALGRLGGHGGRALRAGDVLHVADGGDRVPLPGVDESALPRYAERWEIGVLYGPHGAPDFFTDSDIAAFFAADWKVHYNSSRTGIRLIGPKPHWARPDGGEAGLHPSNIHDNAYAVGAIDFTGDMPVILGPDGPSLGGFVCPAVVVQAELWKLGQLQPGNSVRFKRLTPGEARALETAQEMFVERLALPAAPTVPEAGAGVPANAVAHRIAEARERPSVTYRLSGDKYLLVEYGPMALDLNLRFRVHALMQRLAARRPAGIVDLTPGIRSLQIHYDSAGVTTRALLDLLTRAEDDLPSIGDMEVPSRIVHLPLAWDDSQTRLAVQKYMQSVRRDAPWCPDNIEFIRRINGLAGVDDVKSIVFDASYLVLGLGDVYLGAPVATPVDPRHRLVTTKYNPARTWTPENAVGIGGAYLCIYGMEGPGGYQFVGRTVQVWNRYRQSASFRDGKPWLLRFFDQIRFYPVSEERLAAMREDFVHGQFDVAIEPVTLRLREYNEFLRANASDIARFKRRQQEAFEAERERWRAAGQSEWAADASVLETAPDSGLELPPDARAVASPVSGSVWKILVEPGDHVAAGAPLAIIESMKMELAVHAPAAGTVFEVFRGKGSAVSAGEALLAITVDGKEVE